MTGYLDLPGQRVFAGERALVDDWNRRVAAALPKGRLAVVPGTGHGAPLQRPAW